MNQVQLAGHVQLEGRSGSVGESSGGSNGGGGGYPLRGFSLLAIMKIPPDFSRTLPPSKNS